MVAVIAELKRKSPSKGVLSGSMDPARQAAAFARGGAAAVSVLTEPSFFDGSLADLAAVRAAVALPVLRKDFHIDPLQLVEARAASATAVLLIARALPQAQLAKLMHVAARLGLETIVEVRTEGELARALDCGAAIVGVNSRDLETLLIDERVPERLMPLIPGNVVGVWESGVRDVESVRRAADCGADAVLVGSALSRAADPEALVRSLCGVPRQGRNG
jgi:indole-3-glycerol phosphate synthase